METPATITETPQDRPPTESPPEDMRMQAEAATASLAVNILNEVSGWGDSDVNGGVIGIKCATVFIGLFIVDN